MEQDEIQENETVQNAPQDAPESTTNDFMNNPDILAFIDLKVQEGIKNALQGNTPKSNTADCTEQERLSFDKMSYRERLNLFNSNPQAYNKLSKRSV